MKRRFLREIERGDAVDEVFLVQNANFKQARNGKPFIQMTLRDSTAAVRALRWEASRQEFRRLERNPFAHISGRVEEYQGNLQIIVDELESLSQQDARVEPTDFLPRTRYSVEALLSELGRRVAEIGDAGVKQLVERVLARPEVKKGLPSAPAGKVMHHAYVGGLLEHVVSLLGLARSVAEHYPWLDRDMLVAGVILHDIGKVAELSYDVGFGYTDEGQMVGHIGMALAWVDEAARELPDLDATRVLEIRHLIASHHGKLEFGSPKVPMTGEALALHFLDNLDAKLAAYLTSFESNETLHGDDRWSEFHPMLQARLYFPVGLGARVERWRERLENETEEPGAAPKSGELSFE